MRCHAVGVLLCVVLWTCDRRERGATGGSTLNPPASAFRGSAVLGGVSSTLPCAQQLGTLGACHLIRGEAVLAGDVVTGLLAEYGVMLVGECLQVLERATTLDASDACTPVLPSVLTDPPRHV